MYCAINALRMASEEIGKQPINPKLVLVRTKIDLAKQELEEILREIEARISEYQKHLN